MILQCCHLGEAAPAELAVEGFLACVGPHVPLETGGFKETFATVLAEMCPLIVVLFPVKNRRVSITKLPAAVFTLVDLPHPVRGEVLLQVGGGGEGLLTELALPGLVLVVDSLDVNPHVVASHEQFRAVR